MEKIKFSNIQKKCMYCGKMYPSNWGGGVLYLQGSREIVCGRKFVSAKEGR